MSEYPTTHPWLTFEMDLRRVPWSVWLLLGEAASKCEHLAGVPLQKEFAREMHQIYLAKGVLATTAIEGNTLTEGEVREIMDRRLTLPPSKAYLKKEIDNILAACNSLVDEGIPDRLDPDLLCRFNLQVLEGLELREEVVPGVLRTHGVGVGTYRSPAWQDVPELVDRYCAWLNSLSRGFPEGHNSAFAILQAVFAHLYLAWIHPFGDGNGRTARLVEFAILLRAGVPTPAAHLPSNFYNETRAEYYRRLEAASRRRDPWEFVSYAVQGFADQIRSQVARVRTQQIRVCWLNYVNEVMHDQSTPATRRQRDLVLALSQTSTPVSRLGLRRLTTDLAAAYAGRTAKTLTRDIHALERRGLIRSVEGGFIANVEQILAFLPKRMTDQVRPDQP